MKTITRLLSVALLVASALALAAQSVPPLINYQGQLLAANGSPLPTSDYEVEISLYPAEAGGAVVWGPQLFNGQSGLGLRPKVSAFEGRFNLVLGPEDTAGRQLAEVVAASPALFLELKVGSGSPIAPRQQLLTAPYALSAANATRLNGYDWSTMFSGGDPVNGNLLVGVPAATTDARADINGRMRVRQGIFGSSGIWFNQNAVGDRAFVGMLDDQNVGFYTAAGAGWAFYVDVNTGYSTALGLNIGSDQPLNLGPAKLMGSTTFFSPSLIFRSFYVSGVQNSYFEGDVWANNVKLTSDERLKENLETIEDPLEKIQAIRGVTFNFRENAKRSNLNPEQRRLGVVAQNVQQVLPEAVSAAPDGYLAVNYDGLVPVLIEAVKAQQRQIQSLQEEVAALKAGRF